MDIIFSKFRKLTLTHVYNLIHSIRTPGGRIAGYILEIDLNLSFNAVTISAPEHLGSISLVSQFPYIQDAAQPISLKII